MSRSPSTTTTTRSATRRPLRTALGIGALAVAALAGSVLPAAAAQAQPSAGHAGTRAQIPWSRVGSGWTLATWSPSTNPQTKARAALFLVDARGHRYLDARLPAGTEPLAFSPAAQQALIESAEGTVAEIDLHSGRTHPITIRNLDTVIGYADPKGLSLLVTVDTPQGSGVVPRLERFDAGGRHLVSFPLSDRKAGELGVFQVLPSTDGTRVVAGARRGLAVLNSRTGHVTRRLIPTRRDCDAASWWAKGVVLASCRGVLYTVPVSGAAAHRISLATKDNPFGYDDAWRTGSTPRLGLAENGCGPKTLVRFDRNGHGIRVAVPSPIGRAGAPTYVGHHHDAVTMVWKSGRGCQAGTATLFRYDAQHHRSTAELGASVNGGTVTGALPYPADR